MLRSLDSWIAVAIPIDAARAGRSRFRATAAMIAAFPACSGSNSAILPVATAVQCSRIATGPTEPFHQAQAPTPPATTRPTTTNPAIGRPDLRLPRPLRPPRPPEGDEGRTGSRSVLSVIGMQSGIEAEPLALARYRLDRPAGGVAAEQQSVRSGQFQGLDQLRGLRLGALL